MLRDFSQKLLFLTGATLLLAAGLLTTSGCQWLDSLRGPGFPGWEENGGFRGKNSDAHGSGFLYSRKAEQVEKSLGGNY